MIERQDLPPHARRAGIQKEDYFANKNQDFQKWLQDDSQAFTSEENDEQREFQSAEAETEREWRSTEASLERDHAITMQNNEFVHDKTNHLLDHPSWITL